MSGVESVVGKTWNAHVLAIILLAALLCSGMAFTPRPLLAQTPAAPDEATFALAREPGETSGQRDARRAVAHYFYATQPGLAVRFDDDLKGIDLGQPVEVISLPAGAVLYQYVRQSTMRVGNFFSPTPDAVPDCLGISGTGRVLLTLALPTGQGLRSIAAPILDTWTGSEPVATKGGCAQVVVGDAVKTATKPVTP
jgi:hypothetical protein